MRFSSFQPLQRCTKYPIEEKGGEISFSDFSKHVQNYQSLFLKSSREGKEKSIFKSLEQSSSTEITKDPRPLRLINAELRECTSAEPSTVWLRSFCTAKRGGDNPWL